VVVQLSASRVAEVDEVTLRLATSTDTSSEMQPHLGEHHYWEWIGSRLRYLYTCVRDEDDEALEFFELWGF
jgi:hypothetical protein